MQHSISSSLQRSQGLSSRAALRLNAVCPYYTMFPLDFPAEILSGASAGQWVLDPFCGRGTTLFAARLAGLPAIGIDVNPVAAALAAAKLVTATPTWVIRRCRELLRSGFDPCEVPEGDFWTLAFSPATLLDICRLREQLLVAEPSPSIVALRAVILGVLHGPLRKGLPTYLSNQMPRTYATKPASAVRYWRTRGMPPPNVDVFDVVRRRVSYVFDTLPDPVEGQVRQGDSCVEVARLRNKFSWVITSPPYYGMRTYLADQWLRSWFLGGSADVDYRFAGQLPQRSEAIFVDGLAGVWRSVSERCTPGAHLAIRFGALPSMARDPQALISRSLAEADAGWVVRQVCPAGSPPRGARQADQMAGAGAYVQEVDIYATLGN
jgi:DNA methylase